MIKNHDLIMGDKYESFCILMKLWQEFAHS